MPSASLSFLAGVALSFAALSSAAPTTTTSMVCNADNALRALRATQKAAEATRFCRDFISIPVVTVVIASSTPVTTLTSTSTAVNTVVRTSLTTTTSTALETSVSTVTNFNVATVVTTVAGSVVTRTVTSTQGKPFVAGRGAVAIPSFLTMYPESRLSSACSCFAVSTLTTSVTLIAPTATSVVRASATSTVSRDTTNKLSSTVTSTIQTTFLTTISTTVSTTTTDPATTVTSTAVSTPPAGCDAQEFFYVQASGGSTVDGQYLTAKLAWPGSSDINAVFTTDISLANKFCLDARSRLVYMDKLYDNSNRLVYAFLNTGTNDEQLFFNSEPLVDGCGGNCYYVPFVRSGARLTPNNGPVSFTQVCTLDSNPRTLYLSDGQQPDCSAVTLNAVVI